MQQSYSMFRLSWTLTMQQWGCCTSCRTLQQKENRTQIFFQLMNKHIIYIQMFRKINNRLQNNVIFLFCHSASVIAVTVFLWTCEDNWSYFCCLHPEAGLYKRLSLWLLSQGRGEGRGNEKRKKKEEKKEGGSERRGGAVSTGEISSEHSSAEKTRAELEMSEEERWAGQSQTVPTWSLLQWLFDPQLVWTLTVQLLGINYYYNNSWADISI